MVIVRFVVKLGFSWRYRGQKSEVRAEKLVVYEACGMEVYTPGVCNSHRVCKTVVSSRASETSRGIWNREKIPRLGLRLARNDREISNAINTTNKFLL